MGRLLLSSRHFKQILADFGLFNKVILTENINYEIPKLYENVEPSLNGELVRRKATGKDYIKYKSLDPKLRARLEKENKLDYQLYEYFKKQPTALRFQCFKVRFLHSIYEKS